MTVWSDDDWLKKFSGKTLQENLEEEGAVAAQSEVQEVQRHSLVKGHMALGGFCLPRCPSHPKTFGGSDRFEYMWASVSWTQI